MVKELIIHPPIIAIINGLIIGVAISLIRYKLIEVNFKKLINNPEATVLTTLLTYSGPVILSIPLILGGIVPQYISAIYGAAGMVIPKLYLFIRAFLNRN